jgi:adenylate cyclase
MEAGRVWFLALWRNPLGTVVLYAALLTHFGLALYAIYERRTLRLPFPELLRLALGASIPFLLAGHVIGTRIAHEWFGAEDSYARMVLIYWQARPELGLKQTIMLLIAWTHGMLGLHYWLRLRSWYPRASPWLFAAGLLLPVVALLGFADAGQTLTRLAADPAWLARMQARWRAPVGEQRAALEQVSNITWWTLAALIGGVFVARAARNVWERRTRGVVRVTHADLRTSISVPVGTTVLESSRIAGVPHASVCGGRGRCSTCRIEVVRGLDRIPAASEDEQRVLRRIRAGADVRLACQLRPTYDVSVLRLLAPTVSPAHTLAPVTPVAGDEQDIAVFFADLRRFTRLAERKLPYDVVFFLNRYFEAVGQSIEASGGITNQFTGDGVMALFGVGAGAAEGSRRALMAAREVVDAVARLSESLAAELDGPLRIGIGIHVGPAVVGRMGFGEAMYLTAVGDTVHVASRFQDLTKDYDCQLVISEQVATLAHVDVSLFPRHEIEVRNRTAALAIRVIEDVRRLPLDTAPTTGGRVR